MLEIFQYDFMVRAILAGIAVAVIAPLIGSFLVVKKYSLIGDTLAHIALTGVAVGLLLGVAPIITTLIVTVAAAMVIEYIRLHKKISGEVVLAMFLPGGLALSVVLLGLVHGFNANLFSFLFGSISTVSAGDLMLIIGLAVVTLAVVAKYYKKLTFTAFDEESAKVSGIKTEQINLLLVGLTAVTVSLAMRVVGALLIGALMVIPVVSAQLIARSFKQSICLAVGIAVGCVVVGLGLAYYLSLPAGGAIVLLSLGVFAGVSVLKR